MGVIRSVSPSQGHHLSHEEHKKEEEEEGKEKIVKVSLISAEATPLPSSPGSGRKCRRDVLPADSAELKKGVKHVVKKHKSELRQLR